MPSKTQQAEGKKGWVMANSVTREAVGRRGMFILAVAGAVALAVWKLPEWHVGAWQSFLTPRELLELQNTTRQTLTFILAGGAFMIGLYLVWRRMSATEQWATQALATVRDGQMTERFTRAIEQFGREKLEIRLGGIYALERIARESERDHWPIMEVLCAYVREAAAWREGHPASARLPTDIQAILTVLGRREHPADAEPHKRLNLSHTDLRGADLQNAYLEGIILAHAHLERADLGAAHLEKADLRGAFLSEADLVQANLNGADLREAHLEGAYIVEAQLEGADLGGARLDGAYMGSANLQHADLSGAYLEGAYLHKAKLQGAALHGARALTAVGLSREQREQVSAQREGDDDLAEDDADDADDRVVALRQGA